VTGAARTPGAPSRGAAPAASAEWKAQNFLAPKDGPVRGHLRQGFYGHDKLGFNITRADIAAFTAARIDDDYVRAAPAMSN
jgi:hypothetical protein